MTDDQTQPLPLDDDSYYRDQTAFFGRLRETCPVREVQLIDGRRAWAVTRFEDVRSGLADPRLAKDQHHFPGGAREWPSQEVDLHAHMLHRDPPDHTRIRGLMQHAFTPRRVAALRPRVEEITASLLDAITAEPGAVVDLLAHFARPLPVIVLFELLGLPAEDRERISAVVIDYSEPGQWTRVTRTLAAYLTELIAAKRAEPGDDLISALIHVRDTDADADLGPALTETELLSGIFQLIMAGFDTTVNLIANGTAALLAHPAELARLRADPSLFPVAVEELLRFTNPLNHATDRFTTEEMRLGDVLVPEGEWVLLATSSANRDPDRFPDPDRLDLARDARGHVAFGHGIHFCLGAPLARMEAEVALSALLERFPGLSLAQDAPEELRHRRTSLMNGLESLPVRLA